MRMAINKKMRTRRTIVVVISAILPILALTRSGAVKSSSYSIFSLPQNLGPNINGTEFHNELSMIAPSGLSLYFMSTRDGGLGGNDIYVSQRPTLSAAWGPAQNLGVLNTTSSEVPGGMSPDGREMIFNSNRPGGSGAADLWITTRSNPKDDFGWTTPMNLGPVINTAFGEQTPTFFVDPATGIGTLFFSSDRDSGVTNVKDIYQSTRNPDGTFNLPTPVTELNSMADDNRPALSSDGLEIFFSTNRSGVRETFVSTRTSTISPWIPPTPVDALNDGVAAQPSLSYDGKTIYFTSNRPGGFGDSDIYSAVRVGIHQKATADFDGDGRTDISVFRPSEGKWYLRESQGGWDIVSWGLTGDKIVPADYDGDGRTDQAVFRPSNGTWYVINSATSTFYIQQWGMIDDIPVPGDYDGDGRTDLAVYRNGEWYLLQTDAGISIQQWGLAGDIPASATY